MALLEACRLAHDDDAPRLVWADAVGGERGELVVLQCDLARGALSAEEREVRELRVDELLAAHGTAWAGDLARIATRWEFRRGFVEAAELDANMFESRADAILDAAPLLVSVALTGGNHYVLHQLVTRPAFWQLSALELVEPSLGDNAAGVLLASAALGSLRALGLAGLTSRGAHELVASGELADLEALRLRRLELGDDALIAILRAARGLVRLDVLDLPGDIPAILRALPPRLRELHTGELAQRHRALVPPTVRIDTGPFGLL